MFFSHHPVRRVLSACAVLVCCLLAGCRHRQTAISAPPPPPLQPGTQSQAENTQPAPGSKPSPSRSRKVIYSEVGLASWYGSPYHHRRSADGKIYDQNAMTAAHRTLPMDSVVRVTNVATGQSAVVTITDRGPFVPGRMLDLSRAAAIQSGVWRPGVARVRMDVLRAPKPLNQGGRWCVQIGAFSHSHSAEKLRDHLAHEYPASNVIEFTGPTGHWVRIRPDGEARGRAVLIAQHIRTTEAQAYLVRLD